MADFQIGNCTFSITPVTVMKCFTGIGWRVRGTREEIRQYEVFEREFFPYLIAQDNNLPVEKFCQAAQSQIDAVVSSRALSSDLIARFSKKLKLTFGSRRNQREAKEFAIRYGDWLTGWMNGPYGELAREASSYLESFGVRPLLPSLGAVGSFGNAVCGRYVPSLRAVTVQLDVVFNSKYPRVGFIETLLHEQMHAKVHQNMGDDEKRDLTWLDELAAVLTSQHAISKAVSAIGDDAFGREVETAIQHIRKKQKYGELASAALNTATDPLFAWKTWRDIFALPSASGEGLRLPDDFKDGRLPAQEKAVYSREKVIRPILHKHGWHVKFPFKYGNKYVTVFM